ncbi:hypothetical protein X777_04597 [Ooceraea biroi]|uniref:Uncharacterized protein n=1 Tax=Ooceraea biroi TaxID=2015173 RepID=A0A026X457_OOCBI|nr:hypothetical protein X777_04597 [Ooceraea biroi]
MIFIVFIVGSQAESRASAVTNGRNIPQTAYTVHSVRARSRRGTKARKLTRSSFIPGSFQRPRPSAMQAQSTKNASPSSKRRSGKREQAEGRARERDRRIERGRKREGEEETRYDMERQRGANRDRYADKEEVGCTRELLSYVSQNYKTLILQESAGAHRTGKKVKKRKKKNGKTNEGRRVAARYRHFVRAKECV